MRVLIVEDNPDAQESFCVLLRLLGHEPDHAGNGFRAGVRMAAQQPDAVILDQYRPGMDGLAFLRRMRAHPAWARIPVAVVTAAASHHLEELARELGGTLGPGLVVRKPADPEEVIRRLEELVRAGERQPC
jgi:CheY-like chemotaxis protein